jgi:predicted GNAT superfamily acetyltransferase
MSDFSIRILETPAEMLQVEQLQRQVWPGDETEIVPTHLLTASVRHGGLVIGAAPANAPHAALIGFVFGFPAIETGEAGGAPRLHHHSHMLGVLPEYRNQGVGFLLKRAQWQMARHQGVERITWTYDPLLSRNAHLNIARLGAVCSVYLRDAYGPLRDGLNAGLATDRFQVDWWLNSPRVQRRLSARSRLPLDLAHFLAAGARILNATRIEQDGLPRPPDPANLDALIAAPAPGHDEQPVLLVEIPNHFQALRQADASLAQDWRTHTRALFEGLFERGFIVTDFVHLPGPTPRSFYALSHGDAELPAVKKGG